MSDDIHALSGAYALDALDEHERAQFERHLAGCSTCRAEVDSLREAAAELAVTMEAPPPPALRDRVMRDISRVRPLPPLDVPAQVSTPDPAVPNTASRPDRPRRDPRRWNRGLLAAAAAVVIGVGGVTAWRLLEADRPAPTVAEQVLDASDASRVSKTFPGGATATIVRSPSLGRAVIVTSKMPAAPQGSVYQLWLQDASGQMHSAGLMPPVEDQVLLLKGDARSAVGVGISVEPAGGSTQPTSAPIALFSFT